MDASTPTANKNQGEYETFNDLKGQDISICPLGYVIEIECKFRNSTSTYVFYPKEFKIFLIQYFINSVLIGFYRKRKNKWAMKLKKPKFTTSVADLIDWKASDEEGLTCSKELGFACKNEKQKSGVCNDYQIRVLCSCSKYFINRPKYRGQYVKNFYIIFAAPPTTEQTTATEITSCLPGTEWSDCKINCNQLCNYYKHELNEQGLCLRSQKCIPGCANKTCPNDMFWRDESTCVMREQCTCATTNGSLAKVRLLKNFYFLIRKVIFRIKIFFTFFFFYKIARSRRF